MPGLRPVASKAGSPPAESAAQRAGSVETEFIRLGEGPPTTSLALTADGASAPESVDLLDGGAQAYPRMLLAIAQAQRSVHLEEG